MSSRDTVQPAAPTRSRAETLLVQYVYFLSVVMLLFGLRQWAVILGVLSSPGGPFENMTAVWGAATMHIAVVDPVAAVGLWNQTAWGKVVWVYAALFEVALHTVFIGTFGGDLPVVGFHLFTVAVFILLTIMARRSAPA